MISLKTFHLFFISLSIILTIGYGIYELIAPSNPGIVSMIFALISFAMGCALIFYCFHVIKKFKTI